MREVTVNPRFGRRSWVKLWVNEWLDGTTRFEMTDSQRAFWVDLLAMAGRSRFPGIICAGQINGKFIGYPINKFQSLMSEPMDVEETLSLFERTGKITIEVTQSEPVKLLRVDLCNWNKFQSEYQRQKPYRLQPELQQSDTQSDTQSDKTEVEVEVEVDSDTETETDSETLRRTLRAGKLNRKQSKLIEDFEKNKSKDPFVLKTQTDVLIGSLRELADRKAI
jgi:hypothetical protein